MDAAVFFSPNATSDLFYKWIDEREARVRAEERLKAGEAVAEAKAAEAMAEARLKAAEAMAERGRTETMELRLQIAKTDNLFFRGQLHMRGLMGKRPDRPA